MEPGFPPFGPDPSWYQKYWFNDTSVEPSPWTKRIKWATALFHRARRHVQAPMAPRSREHEIVMDKI